MDSASNLTGSLDRPKLTEYLAYAPELDTLHAVDVTCEFSSEVASFDFDTSCGELWLIDEQPTMDPPYTGPYEPAEVRAHPHGGFVYVNNRGEDSVTWSCVASDGRLSRMGHVSIGIGRYIHPKFGTRSFEFSPSGAFMLLADRPANMLRSYAEMQRMAACTPCGLSSTHRWACLGWVH